MHFSTLLVAAMAMFPSALATPVAAPAPSGSVVPARTNAAKGPPVIVLGDLVPEAKALELSASVNITEVSIAEAEVEKLGKRSYIGTCSQCTITNTVDLNCYCQAISGSWQWTWIDLNRCLANWNANLGWAINGNYKQSCSGYYVFSSYRYFRAICNNNGGGSQWTPDIDLNTNMHNWDGIIGCQV